jgi:hypothetical protein
MSTTDEKIFCGWCGKKLLPPILCSEYCANAFSDIIKAMDNTSYETQEDEQQEEESSEPEAVEIDLDQEEEISSEDEEYFCANCGGSMGHELYCSIECSDNMRDFEGDAAYDCAETDDESEDTNTQPIDDDLGGFSDAEDEAESTDESKKE